VTPLTRLLADVPFAGQRLMISALRIAVGLLYLQHGTSKLLGFPVSRGGMPEPMSWSWIAGCIELVGGALLVVGLLTRPVAFLCAGQLAAIYWFWLFPRDPLPYLNGGSLVIAYCFAFLTVFFTGPGPISLDRLLFGPKKAPEPHVSQGMAQAD
jgi:putative oxidoreductase